MRSEKYESPKDSPGAGVRPSEVMDGIAPSISGYTNRLDGHRFVRQLDQQLGLGCMIPFLDSNKQTQTNTHKAWQRLAGGRAQN